MNAMMMAASEPWDESRVIRVKAHVEVVVERDPRSMNHMDADTKLVHCRLEEWAGYVKRWAGAQGYPSESYYHKWALLKIAPNPGHEAELPERPAQVDFAVSRLGAIDKSVILRYYLHWRPVDIWKQLSGIPSHHKFNIVLKRARWRVDGFLNAIEKVEGAFKRG